LNRIGRPPVCPDVQATVTLTPDRVARPGDRGRDRRGGVATSEADLLRALHDEHAHVLWAYVVRLTGGDRARAQDVVQETLLRAWRNPSVLDQSAGSARGWLFTVARRIVIDDWRTARSRSELVTDRVPERSVPDMTEQMVDRQLVTAALRTLSAEHRDVIMECYFRGSSVAEAAETLGIPPGTVKSRTHYALRALRLALEEMGGALR
jgi:RNA polymerase sigma-70 factor (ECF subfamily)